MPKLERVEFDMACRNGWEKATGYRVGELAVHGAARSWQASHIATGYAVPYSSASTRKGAIEIATHLDSMVDWSRIRRRKVRGRTARPGEITGHVEVWPQFEHAAISLGLARPAQKQQEHAHG